MTPTGRGKQKSWETKLSECDFVHHKSDCRVRRQFDISCLLHNTVRLFQASAAVQIGYSGLCDVTQRRLIVTDVSGQHRSHFKC